MDFSGLWNQKLKLHHSTLACRCHCCMGVAGKTHLETTFWVGPSLAVLHFLQQLGYDTQGNDYHPQEYDLEHLVTIIIYHHFLCHCHSAEQPIQLLMELVSAFSRRRDLSMLHAFFCAVTCCLGKSLSHYLSLHLLFLLFCQKPCSHFLGKSHSNWKTSKKTPRASSLQPICYLSTAQLPKNTKNLARKTCQQRNGHTALHLLHLWLRSRLENLSRVNRAIRAKPQELFFLKSAMWENDATFPGTVVFFCWGVFL